MFERGKRGLALGGVVLLLTAAVHTFGVCLGQRAGTADDARILEILRTTPIGDFGSWHPTLQDMLLNWGVFMSLGCAAFGLLTLLQARLLPAGHAALRILAWTGFGLCLSAAILAVATKLPPPLAFFAPATLAYGWAALQKNGASVR